ncbi:MAG: GNAT family N-acetyltransferase [Candidatus Izemoplasmatales bacterium]|nr:GNAT family N-acetyltransferase [Candidatus Izemoplasmatales bacterium]
MLKSGKTPLFRARNIEKILGLKQIYIKHEGTNPTGHKCDRVNEAIVRDARNRHDSKMLVQGSLRYIQSLLMFAQAENLEVKIPLFKNERWKHKAFSGDAFIDLRGSKHVRSDTDLHQYARENGYYLALEGRTDQTISHVILGDIAHEIIDKSLGPIDRIYLGGTYGHTLKSTYEVFLKHALSQEIEHSPEIITAIDVPSKSSLENTTGVSSVQEICRHLDCRYIEPSPRWKQEAVMLLKKEQIRTTASESLAFAAFLQDIAETPVSTGKFIIILDGGISDISITQVKDFSEMTRSDITSIVRDLLAPYQDSEKETADAIDNAIDKGFILIAKRSGQLEGISVVVHTGFKDFIPTYHLAYIGVHRQSKGRGIGMELIQKVIDLTGGNVSLHVDLSNAKAKKVYEKMGFAHRYNRMIYTDD